MALNLIHGDNQFLSRNHFHKILDSYKTQGFKDITRVEGKKVSLEEVIQGVESQSFFASNRLVIIDNLISTPKSNRQSDIVAYLGSLDPNQSHVILWESKVVTPAKLKKLAPFSPQLFKSSPIIFKLLDSIYPGNAARFLKMFNQACEQDSPEFVFYMLVKRVRQLIQSTGDSLKVAPWQLARLKQQYQKFPASSLLDLHSQLYKLDNQIKTGKSPLPIQSELQMILIKLQ